MTRISLPTASNYWMSDDLYHFGSVKSRISRDSDWHYRQYITKFHLAWFVVLWSYDQLCVFTRSRRDPGRGAPGWLAMNPVRGIREPPSRSMHLQKLQFQSVIYGNPEHSNWYQSFPTHIWLFSAQCGMLVGFIKTMQAGEMQNYKKHINIL